MRRTLLTLLAVIGLTGATALTATAATTTPTLNVSYTVLATTANTTSSCAVGEAGVSMHLVLPTQVVAEATNVTRYGYHSITGYSFIGASGYPGQILVSNVYRSWVYPAHQYDVWVPGYAGRACTSWVHLVAQDS